MKELTAEKVLEKTFNHLDEMLKNDQPPGEEREPRKGVLSGSDREADANRKIVEESVVDEK